MKKILNSIQNLFVKSLWTIGLASLILATNLILLPSSYAAPPIARANEKVIQPFELTNPAATRSEAYDEIAKLNKDPKALIEAEMKEEQAEEKAFKQEQKEIESAGK
ncbi:MULTISPECIES: hypothetical protein [unclassified Chamaesiphon]|uniref:hypothetical protein n=1 Tax=unclassified Chamaesiphon TaxID=2620921 RepID=UPI00286D3C69|nr:MULTISPECIES: hypothetical protein [unclassified Chamaesiphon]